MSIWLLVIGLAFLAFKILNRNKSSKRSIFAYIYTNYLEEGFIKVTAPYRKELLGDLNKMKSNDPELRERGFLRILEVGVGNGCNLQYYPDGTRFVSVDPNEKFVDSFNENRANYPKVHLERHYVCGGEDMSGIADESVDAVVGTYVFCSVDDVDQVLREMYRVLVKGGKLFFLEHVVSTSKLGKLTQILLQPLWSLTCDDCNLTRDPMEHLGRSKFKIERKSFFDAEKLFPWIRSHVLGIAFKDNLQ